MTASAQFVAVGAEKGLPFESSERAWLVPAWNGMTTQSMVRQQRSFSQRYFSHKVNH